MSSATPEKLDQYLRFQLGAVARWRLYDRSVPTPLNVLIDVVDERFGVKTRMVWVDGGAPAVFSPVGLVPPVAVWSTRHLEVAAALRNLVVNDALSGQRRELARRMVLSVVAELLLGRGRHDEAARCFLLAISGQGVFLPQAGTMADLEAAEINEAFVALWGFGLAHEFGHHLPDGGAPDDAAMWECVVDAYRAQPAIATAEPALLQQLLERAQSGTAHPCAPSHLRAEVAADLFGVEMLLHAADAILARVGRSRRPTSFAIEAAIALVGVSFIERCTSLAEQHDDADGWLRMFDATAAFTVRQYFTRLYLTAVLTDDSVDPQRAVAAFDDVLDGLGESVNVVDSGLADAMRQLLDRTVTTSELLGSARKQCKDAAYRAMVTAEHGTFLTNARGAVAKKSGGLSEASTAATEELERLLRLFS